VEPEARSTLRNVRRWFGRRSARAPFNLDLIGSPRWDERAEAAVAMLSAHAHRLFGFVRPIRIADFGCGDERLRRVLADALGAPYRYTGYDVLPQRETVVEIDLRRELPRDDFDLVFCLGLLEYLDAPVQFLQRVKQRYPDAVAVVSYAIVDAPRPLRKRERRARGWLTDYTRAAFELEFEASGLVCSDTRLTNDGRTGLWLLDRRAAQET
jgi:SAM-dependent methyltransferase